MKELKFSKANLTRTWSGLNWKSCGTWLRHNASLYQFFAI